MGLAKRRWEEVTSRGFDETDNLTVCLECIDDTALREETRPHLEEWVCSFCGAEADEGAGKPIAASFEDFMYIVIEAVNFLYTSVENAGLVYDEGEWYGGNVLDSNDVAYAVCEGDVTYEVLEAISSKLTSQLWTDSHISESRPDKALKWGWDAFCNKVKHSSRFVFLSTKEETSDHPDDYTTAQLLQRLERIIVDNEALLTVPAGRVFWRGRLADSPSKIAEYGTAAALGSPPHRRASNNRMSPAGISMFYGSDNIDTVVAEIGAHSTQRYAIVGAFKTTQEMTLLNLADLPPVPSLYQDTGRGQHYYELQFLHSFAADLGKPVSLDGQEHIEYVPTQVATEYLRFIPDFAVDGILFRSAQNNDVNCVLFCEPDECFAQGDPTKPFQSQGERRLQLQPETVRSVRIITGIADS